MKHLPAHSRNPWHHTYVDYITEHHRWPAIFSIWVCERVHTEYGKRDVSGTRLCAGQSPGTFPPWAAQPNTCRAQHSGYLTRASRTGWLACVAGDVHSPLRRGSPVCCVMRKAWGPVCLWGDPPAHPKKQCVRLGEAADQDKNRKQIYHYFSKMRSWFLDCFSMALNLLIKHTLWFLQTI